jgi:hypothetical protein
MENVDNYCRGDNPRYGKVLEFTSAQEFADQENMLQCKRYEEKKIKREEVRAGPASGFPWPVRSWAACRLPRACSGSTQAGFLRPYPAAPRPTPALWPVWLPGRRPRAWADWRATLARERPASYLHGSSVPHPALASLAPAHVRLAISSWPTRSYRGQLLPAMQAYAYVRLLYVCAWPAATFSLHGTSWPRSSAQATYKPAAPSCEDRIDQDHVRRQDTKTVHRASLRTCYR